MYCLDPDTRVLGIDLIWRPIKDLVVGDEVVAFDEHVKPGEGQRKMRRATVEGVRWSRSAPVRITFEDGSSVVSSENHRWFSVSDDANNGEWKFAGRPPRRQGSTGRLAASLRPGDNIRFIVDPWETDDTRDGGYLAGLLDGEGSIGSKVKYKRIVSIEPMPEQDLVDIQTSEATFIAEGFVSHNTASTPSLDQFGKYAIIFEPSSPWQMMGQFYENYLHSIEMEDSHPVYPEMLMLQLTSWDIYLDWERAHEMDVLPEHFRGDRHEYFHPERNDPASYPAPLPIDPDCTNRLKANPRLKRLKGPIQAYDEQMARLERANPETFKVERRSHFAAALDAYLNPHKVAEIFVPWDDRPERYGPALIEPQAAGLLAISYKGHGDPSKVNDKFGIAVAHAEIDAEGRAHCVFDLLHHFDPADFDDGIIDYEYVDDWIWSNVIKVFYPDEFTFDQYNSTSSIQRLQKRIRNTHLPKRVDVFEKTTTGPYDWTMKENSKAAINLGLVHAPPVTSGESYDRAELELRFLQSPRPGKVDHPTSGPVQSKDIADAMTECIQVLIGEQVNNFMHTDLSAAKPMGAAQGGFTPYEGAMDRAELDTMRQMSGFGRARGARDLQPTRAMRARGGRPGRN